jgi:methylenetetrahydrofolate reductase (NADPH)
MPEIDLSLQTLAECPKTMTNGPCGGVALDGTCEVDRSKLCVWHQAVNRWPASGPIPLHLPADWSQAGPAMWETAFGANSQARSAADTPDKSQRPERSGSRFERLLRSGRFVVTCEINPTDSADATPHLERVRPLIGLIDAVHISDNSLASPHMCGLALGALIERLGMETILHMTCRDRNRLMLQADVLGATALGIKNILCLTGDHPAIGDHPRAKPVFDLDAISLIDLLRRMRDDGVLESGRALETPPSIFIGGGAEPTSPPLEYRPHRLGKKIAAGLDFAVTQVVFDMDLLAQFLARVRDLGLDKKIYLLVSVAAIGSPSMARGMNANTPGVVVPEHIIRRLERARMGKRRAEGLKICVEQIQQLLEMPGVAGIDVMDLEPERYLEIIEAAGLKERPMAASAG